MKEGREGGKKRGTKEGRRGWSFDQTDRQTDRQTEVLRSDPIAIYRFSIKSDVLAKTVAVEDMEVQSQVSRKVLKIIF